MPLGTPGRHCAASPIRVLILGSHLDSVPNGGWLDGCLGVLASFEVLRGWQRTSMAGPPLPFAWWIGPTRRARGSAAVLFGSSAFAGTHTIQADRGRTDRDGIRLEDALQKCHVDVERIGDAGNERAHAGAYLELHIEQGPVLEAMQLPLGRGARDQGRGTPRDHLPWTGGAFRVHSDGRAAGCLGRRGQACPGDSTHCAETSGRGGDHGECKDFSGHRDRGCRPLRNHSGHARSGRGCAGFDVGRRRRLPAERFAAEEGCTVEWSKIWSIEPIPFNHRLIEFAIRQLWRRRASPTGCLQGRCMMLPRWRGRAFRW